MTTVVITLTDIEEGGVDMNVEGVKSPDEPGDGTFAQLMGLVLYKAIDSMLNEFNTRTGVFADLGTSEDDAHASETSVEALGEEQNIPL